MSHRIFDIYPKFGLPKVSNNQNVTFSDSRVTFFGARCTELNSAGNDQDYKVEIVFSIKINKDLNR